MTFVAEPFGLFVDDLLTGLTGGVVREGFRFLAPDGWVQRARAELPAGRYEKPELLVAYTRVSLLAESRRSSHSAESFSCSELVRRRARMLLLRQERNACSPELPCSVAA